MSDVAGDPQAVQRPLIAIDGLAYIAEPFDHVLIDQFGVLHDGARPYPRVLDCLAKLRRAGKNVVVLSNSARTGAENARRLGEFGIRDDAYSRVLTSGDAVRQAIADGAPPFDRLGRRCLLFTRDGDRSVVDGLELETVDDPAVADFLLLGGIDDARADPDIWQSVFERALAAGLPMVCANPDTTMISGGRLLPGPGAIAERFRAMGGDVTLFGKPHPGIYAIALAALGNPSPSRVLAIGDSLEHDILGARRSGIASLLITGGILARHFADGAPAAATAIVRRLAGGDESLPDWVMSELAWNPERADGGTGG